MADGWSIFLFFPAIVIPSMTRKIWQPDIDIPARPRQNLIGEAGTKSHCENSVHPSRAPPYEHMRRRNALLTRATLHDSIFRRTVLSKSCTVSMFEIKGKVTQPRLQNPSQRSCKLKCALMCRRWHSPDSFSTPALVFLVRFHACCRFSSRLFGINLACFTFAFSPLSCAVWLLP